MPCRAATPLRPPGGPRNRLPPNPNAAAARAVPRLHRLPGVGGHRQMRRPDLRRREELRGADRGDVRGRGVLAGRGRCRPRAGPDRRTSAATRRTNAWRMRYCRAGYDGSSRRHNESPVRDRLASCAFAPAVVPSRRPDDRRVRAGLGRVCAGAVPGPGPRTGRRRCAPAQFPDGDFVDLPARLHRGAPVRRRLAHGLPAGRAQPEHPVVGADAHAGQPARATDRPITTWSA